MADGSDDFDRHLRAGAALYNAGEFHAAHDPWEERWLALGGDACDADESAIAGRADDRRFLKGLIQLTAAVYHATERNWTGTTGLAEGALGYLDGLGGSHADLALGPVRSYLGLLASDPAAIERRPPVRLTLDGRAIEPSELEFEAAALAAAALAEEYDYEARIVERAAAFGREDLASGRASSPFVSLLLDFVTEGNRSLVVRRLAEHVDRREHREAGVAGLFDVGGDGRENGEGKGDGDGSEGAADTDRRDERAGDGGDGRDGR